MSKKLTFQEIIEKGVKHVQKIDFPLRQWQRPPYSRTAPRSALGCLS